MTHESSSPRALKVSKADDHNEKKLVNHIFPPLTAANDNWREGNYGNCMAAPLSGSHYFKAPQGVNIE
jgi:hypothetical protein